MAAPIKSFGEFFPEFDSFTRRRTGAGSRPATGGPLTLERPETGGGLTLERPRTPPSPPTPTFDQTTGREVPQKAPPTMLEGETRPTASVAGSYAAPTEPAPQPTGETPAQATPFASSGSSGKSMYGYKAPQASQDFWNQIFAPVTQGVSSGFEQLGGAVGEFREEAGDVRSFSDVGGEEMIRRAAETGDPAAMEAARAAIGASYTGPQGLDPETLAALRREFQDIAPYAQNLSSVAGVGALLEEARPGLTGGSRRIEAQRLLESPEFREITRTLGRDIGHLGGTTEAEQLAAEGFAGERTESEAEIARLARQALEGRRGSLDEELERRIAEEDAKRLQAEDAYDYFRETGDASKLQALDLGFDPAMFETELTKLDREAQAAREAIVGKPEYERIKDIPLMSLAVTKKGSKRYEWDPEWWEANKEELLATYGKKGVGKLKGLARQRQKELTQSGFDPLVREGIGKYVGVENLYGEDLFDPQAGYEQFTAYDPGSVATKANIAGTAERAEYNRIQDLLGQASVLEATDPYQAAQIKTDLEGWAAAQEAQYEDARAQLEALGYEFAQTAKKQKKAYKKSKEKAGAQIGATIGSVLGTLIGGYPGTLIGGYAGGELGKSIGGATA